MPLRALKTSIAQVEGEILGLHGQQVRVKNQLTENMKRTLEALARKTRLEHENSKINDEKVQVYQRCESINSAYPSSPGPTAGIDSGLQYPPSLL